MSQECRLRSQEPRRPVRGVRSTVDRFASVVLLAISVGPAVAIAVVGGYAIGSIPVAVLVGRSQGIDLRTVGDRNPGYWNAKQQLPQRAAMLLFAGDLTKGIAAGLLGTILSTNGRWWIAYLAVGAAMLGHAFPVFAGFRGGRSILTFAGGAIVLSPRAAAAAIVLTIVVTVAARSFRVGRTGRCVQLPAAAGLVRPAGDGGGHRMPHGAHRAAFRDGRAGRPSRGRHRRGRGATGIGPVTPRPDRSDRGRRHLRDHGDVGQRGQPRDPSSAVGTGQSHESGDARTSRSEASTESPRPDRILGSGAATVNQRRARSATCDARGVTSASASDRAHPVHRVDAEP